MIVEPFCGIRPRPDLASEISSPPYDVLERDEISELCRSSQITFMRVLRPEVLLGSQINPTDLQIHAEARRQLDQLIGERKMIKDLKPCFYLYRLEMGEHVQVGLLAVVRASEYFSGKIKKHEHIRIKDLEDRIRHIQTLGANTGPIFLTYRAQPEVDEIISQITAGDPVFDFSADDGISHRFWALSGDNEIAKLKSLFNTVDALYIADGHHRMEAAAQVARQEAASNPDHTGNEPHNFIMAALFPHDQVQILACNRVVHDLAGQTVEEFLAALEEDFSVVACEGASPTRRGTFGMYLAGKWHRLTLREAVTGDDAVEALDVSILQRRVLEPLLAISNPRLDKRIEFVGGVRGFCELERRAGTRGVAFSCYPIEVADLMKIADLGQSMPPKSTWIEPKLRSGLVVHKFKQ